MCAKVPSEYILYALCNGPVVYKFMWIVFLMQVAYPNEVDWPREWEGDVTYEYQAIAEGDRIINLYILFPSLFFQFCFIIYQVSFGFH